MVDKAKFVAEARAHGIPDAKIADYLAARTGSQDFLTNARAAKADDTKLVDFLVSKPDEQADGGSTPLQANDTLGFVNGGARTLNNIMGAESKGLQVLGVDPNAIHAVGRVLRNPFKLFGGQAMPNNDQLAQLNDQGAAAGDRPGKLGEFAGEVAGTAPLAFATGGLGSISVAPEWTATQAISNPLLRSAAEKLVLGGQGALRVASGQGVTGAATQGALQGLETAQPGSDATTNAVLGGLGGVGGMAFNKLLGGVIAPRLKPAVQQLLKFGVKGEALTPATRSGSGYAKFTEDTMRSLPGPGGFVRNSQQNMVNDLERAALQRSADTAGVAVPPVTARKPNFEDYKSVKQALKTRLNGIDQRTNVSTDANLHGNQQHGRVVQAVLHEDGLPGLASRVKDLYGHYDPQAQQWVQGSLSGDNFRQVDQSLRQAERVARTPAPGQPLPTYQLRKADAIAAAHDNLMQSFSDQQPDVFQKYKDAQAGYSMFKRLQEASVKNAEGFSPKTWYDAIMNGQGRASKINMGSTGDLPDQTVAKAALDLMGTKIGDSGTASRAAIGKVMTGDLAGAAGMAGAYAAPGVVGATAHVAIPPALAAYAPYYPGVGPALGKFAIARAQNGFLQAARKFAENPVIQNETRNVLYKAALNGGTN